jgi:hypothetical protein
MKKILILIELSLKGVVGPPAHPLRFRRQIPFIVRDALDQRELRSLFIAS